MSLIPKLPTAELEELRDQAEAKGDWPVYEECEAELERRDYDVSDPWSHENHHD